MRCRAHWPHRISSSQSKWCAPAFITDLEPKRLDFAKVFVLSAYTYQVDQNLDALGNAKKIRELFDFENAGEYGAPETVLECTGVENSVVTAAYTARRGGIVMVIGVGKEIMDNLPFMHLSLAEIDLRLINRYSDTWPAGLQCLAEGILDLKPFVSHTFSLEKALNALHTCADLTNGNIKVKMIDDVDDVF